jgi:hypothetical protein
MTTVDREPPPTLVVSELISTVVQGEGAYENPKLSQQMLDRLERIYSRFASQQTDSGSRVMSVQDVETWLIAINNELGRGSEYRQAAREMGWRSDGDDDKAKIKLPPGGLLSLEGFINVYESELRQGKFWSLAYDMAVLGEPLPDVGVFEARYDRMYCSAAVRTTAVMDFTCSVPCPNKDEPSDHLCIAASFEIRKED